MNKYSFWTNTVIPIEGFTTFGINAKPNSTNPIGFFGTGLKYAVAIILRHGGTIRLFIDGVEYEFYVKDKDFRGKVFQQCRMKKRKGVLSRWNHVDLPFTTELGKNWELWQAYRELESNTRDEGGESYEVTGSDADRESKGTYIEVDCKCFVDVAAEDNLVFLDSKGKLIYEGTRFDVYDSPSKWIYFRGVRAHDLRYPARFTYDLKAPHFELSEDRSIKNSFVAFYYISSAYMTAIDDVATLNKALNTKEGSPMHFEGHDLQFDATTYGASDSFRSVARKLSIKGFAGPQVFGYHSAASAVYSHVPDTTEVKLTDDEWKKVVQLLADSPHDVEVQSIIDKIEQQL